MLTFFTIPKAFNGHFGMIQCNAIESWRLLSPKSEIILLGNESGTKDMAQKFGCLHIPEVEKNEYGTPMLKSVFEKAEKMASNHWLCYINADIILMDDFMGAFKRAVQWRKRFLLTGQRWDVLITQPLDFSANDWQVKLRVHTLKTTHHEMGFDWFVFPKNFFNDIPPLAIGRGYFDFWLLWKARELNASLIDATSSVLTVHQKHDYSHIQGVGKMGMAALQEGPERMLEERMFIVKKAEGNRNWEAVHRGKHLCRIDDVTHHLTPQGIRFSLAGTIRFSYRLNTLWFFFLKLTRPLRHPLGLRRSPFKNGKVKNEMAGL